MEGEDRKAELKQLWAEWGIEPVACLGAGGQAEVWSARCTNAKLQASGVTGPLAMKWAWASGGPSLLRRLESEHRILLQLAKRGHRHIIRIASKEPMRCAQGIGILMEFVSGKSLRRKLQLPQEHPLSVADRLTCCAQIADALAVVHAEGHIHRDVKPDNILIEGDGKGLRAVLIDFGVAKDFDYSHQTEDQPGTSLYMAPEMRYPHGNQAQPTAAADIYSFGATLWFALTGKDLFRSGNPAGEQFRRGDGLPSVAGHIAHAPDEGLPTGLAEDLDGILGMTVVHDPESRSAAKDVAAALSTIVRTHFHPSTMIDPKILKKLTRRQLWILLTIGCLLVGVALAGWQLYRGNQTLGKLEQMLSVQTLPDYDSVMKELADAASGFSSITVTESNEEYRPIVVTDFFGFGNYTYRTYSRIQIEEDSKGLIDRKVMRNEHGALADTLQRFMFASVPTGRLGLLSESDRKQLLSKQFSVKELGDMNPKDLAADLDGYRESYKWLLGDSRYYSGNIAEVVRKLRAQGALATLADDAGFLGQVRDDLLKAFLEADKAFITYWCSGSNKDGTPSREVHYLNNWGMQIFYFRRDLCIISLPNSDVTGVRGIKSTNLELNESFRLVAKNILKGAETKK